jgi:hypothetical protein
MMIIAGGFRQIASRVGTHGGISFVFSNNEEVCELEAAVISKDLRKEEEGTSNASYGHTQRLIERIYGT